MMSRLGLLDTLRMGDSDDEDNGKAADSDNETIHSEGAVKKAKKNQQSPYKSPDLHMKHK